MATTLNRSLEFCHFLYERQRNHSLTRSHFKQLTDRERKTCLFALKTVERAQLGDWNKKENSVKKIFHSEKVAQITKKIRELPREKPKLTPWSSEFFVWIAKKLHCLFLWIQNTFMGRTRSKALFDEVVSFCQETSNAPQRIKDLNEDFEKIKSVLAEKSDQKKKILVDDISKGLLEIYKILLAIKSEGKRESIMEAATKFACMDTENPEKVSSSAFYQIVYKYLSPYFQENSQEELPLMPLIKLNLAALSLHKIQMLLKKETRSQEVIGHSDDQRENADRPSRNEPQLTSLKNRFFQQCQTLRSNFQELSVTYRPLLVQEKTDYVKKYLSVLYKMATAACHLEERAKKTLENLKTAYSEENKLRFNHCQKQLEKMTVKTNKQFSQVFLKIESQLQKFGNELQILVRGNRDNLGKKLYTKVNVAIGRLPKLDFSKIHDYGTLALRRYRNYYEAAIKLLEKKYCRGD